MDFVNNWQAELTSILPTGTGMALPVPPAALARLAGGVYLLTLTDGEVVEIIRYDGAAELVTERGLEGTQPQAWPVDTVIYAAVTAGQLSAIMGTLDSSQQQIDGLQQQIDGLQQQIDGLQQQIDGLQQQIDACCSGGGGEGLTDQNGNTLTDQNGNTLEA